MSGRAGTCPSCGSALTFAVGSSHAAVCRFCNSLVARQGQGFELIGKVADLTPTGTRIALGAHGHHAGQSFTVVGRLQLAWADGIWDEWYVSFGAPHGGHDGGAERWGWLAEAQGRYYLTFPMPTQNLPPAAALAAGRTLDIAPHGHFVVTDIKDATVASAAGELPEAVSLGRASHSADLEGSRGIFATLDYGEDGRPTLFVGVAVTLESLDLQGGVPSGEPAPEGEALQCKNCGAPVSVRVPGQTVRLTCAKCNALLDFESGAMRLVKVLERQRVEPPIPLGTLGVLRGRDVMVIGWMRRGCDVSGSHYAWEELLVYEPKTTALSWLVLSVGHWSSATAISAADVEEFGTSASYRGKRYRRFSLVTGTVEQVLGEFPWKVHVGESAQLQDYVAAPEGLSVETSVSEVNWSHVEHLEPSEVAAAFGIAALAREPRVGVGAVQPWFFEAAIPSARRWMLGGIGASFLVLFMLMGRGHSVLTHTFTLADMAAAEPSEDGAAPPADPAATPADARVCSFLSEPFELTGREAVEIAIDVPVDNAWAYVETGLIREDTGDVAIVGLEAAYYHGREGGEDWSEGSHNADTAVSAPKRGSYLIRADLQWDPKLPSPPAAVVVVRAGGYSGLQFMALLAALLSPLLLHFHRKAFEKKRWEESNVNG